ncbi:hypothetical protein AYO21_11460 [Fonsecaea monophora]|uniref:Uncharacterized protein n=1 Tax=Fonsecaea monophora TaxID=254056 RepID=A0A177EQU3_9EURO|nr:hypothetical protein AYO21_11460 [Fonsecaea monophora]OAG34374.1 hypothetical protein AYO21_11460 [Fonsecaea monophora]
MAPQERKAFKKLSQIAFHQRKADHTFEIQDLSCRFGDVKTRMTKTMNDDLMDVRGRASDPKRRKAISGSNGRYFQVKKWVQLPVAVAERMPQPKYLADRRPGMNSLYQDAYKATNGFGTLADIVTSATRNGTTG